MELDVEAARAAVQKVADAMGLDSVEQAAEGIIAIVNENMAGALRLVSVQRGHDPRDFALVAYGGAGPLHANALAKLMGSFPVIVPPAPGLLCAIGDLVADFRDEFAQTYIRLVVGGERRRGRRHPRRPRRAGDRPGSTGEGIAEDAQRIAYTADMRYHRQGYEIPVALDPAEVRADGLGDLEERFNALHEQLYGFRMPGTASRDRQPARGRLRRRAEAGAAGRRSSARRTPRPPSSTSTRSSSTASACRRRSTTARSSSRAPLLAGPAIVTEFDSTTVVLPGYRAEVDANFNILITPND